MSGKMNVDMPYILWPKTLYDQFEGSSKPFPRSSGVLMLAGSGVGVYAGLELAAQLETAGLVAYLIGYAGGAAGMFVVTKFLSASQ